MTCRGGRRSSASGLALGIAVLVILVWSPAASAQTSTQNDRCFACHAQTDLGTVDVNGVQKSLTVDRAVWDTSLHSLLDCTSCHVGFKPDKHTATEAQGWYREATLTACGDCHAGESTAYSASIHGRNELKEGTAGGAPTCGMCHDAHAIAGTSSPGFRIAAAQRCESCHGGRTQSYLDTYHGKAFELGRTDAATCPDCHGGHQILPASDTASTVSSQHIVATCAKCHPGANAAFASYRVHAVPSSPKSGFLIFGVYSFYIVLIAIVFAFGGVHSVLYFYRGRKQGLYRRAHD